MGGEKSFTDEFKDKIPIFKALRGSELETRRWEDENFHLFAVSLSYFSERANFIKRNISQQRKKENYSRKETCHP